MKMTLMRGLCSAKSTPGMLFIDGVFECYTLEDVVRPEKIAGCTAIPAGIYPIDLTMSNRFKTILPLLVGVPGFEGVRIHPGNTAADTEGCILVGDEPTPDFLGKSRAAFNRLLPKITAAWMANDPITLEIK